MTKIANISLSRELKPEELEDMITKISEMIMIECDRYVHEKLKLPHDSDNNALGIIKIGWLADYFQENVLELFKGKNPIEKINEKQTTFTILLACILILIEDIIDDIRENYFGKDKKRIKNV